MKKALFIALAISLMAAPAFAGYSTGSVTLGSTTNKTMDIQTSNNVQLDYAAGGNGDTFAVSSYHDKGTRTFASSSGDAKIYYQNATAVSVPTAPAIGSTMAPGSWTAL